MGARNAPSMAHYGPSPGYPAPSSQVSRPGGGKSWLPVAVAGGAQVGMLRVQAQVDPRHAWMLLLSVLLQLRMARLCPVLMRRRRRGRAGQVRLGRGGSGQAKLSQAKPRQFKAIQGRPRQGKSTPPRLGSSAAHQPCVYGMAWVGWRDRNAPWMAHFEPPWMGSRRVPWPHPRRPATHQPEMPLLPWLQLQLSPTSTPAAR